MSSKPPKRYSGLASSGPGRLYPVGGSRPNTSPKSTEYPDTRRRPHGPSAS
ncbi:hypothetical protein ABZ135_37955 [Streptomyces sp. NPDC006339]|uniref:hypothetical protein n=1 Tax=Streptomyces sp. NPDC006339 TaxID=3156755 RepID=UPI0033A882F7